MQSVVNTKLVETSSRADKCREPQNEEGDVYRRDPFQAERKTWTQDLHGAIGGVECRGARGCTRRPAGK